MHAVVNDHNLKRSVVEECSRHTVPVSRAIALTLLESGGVRLKRVVGSQQCPMGNEVTSGRIRLPTLIVPAKCTGESEDR
jgi:hypothetical protein